MNGNFIASIVPKTNSLILEGELTSTEALQPSTSTFNHRLEISIK